MMRLIGYQSPVRQPAPIVPVHPSLWPTPVPARRIKALRLRQRPQLIQAGLPT